MEGQLAVVDEIDVALSRLLMRNSRTTYSDLGKELGLSPQVVHRRVQSLIDADIIRGTYATLSFKARGSMWVVVHGWSRARSMDEVDHRFRTIPEVGLFQVASGNYVYVHGNVKNSAEMADFVSAVQRDAQISEPHVGIVPLPQTPAGALTIMDLRIVHALAADARRPISEVAGELGTTVKTVRRRLNRMVQEDLIMLSINWQPDTLGDTISQIHLVLRDDVPRERSAFLLIKRFATGVLRTYTFSNLPNELLITYWSKNVREMQNACRELEAEGIFASVVPNILRAVYYYDEHQKGPLREMMRMAKKKPLPLDDL
ncbi:MAG: AsnC family transcriptional regulator [Methanomassiliicoccales archaeon]|nr:AsnC family transcriptional regulator [Methanomassiliicoccales archaeon]